MGRSCCKGGGGGGVGVGGGGGGGGGARQVAGSEGVPRGDRERVGRR